MNCDGQAKRRKQAELAASLEAMRQVFGERDEKLLTIWLAEANSDVAAAINIGLAYDEKVEQRRTSIREVRILQFIRMIHSIEFD